MYLHVHNALCACFSPEQSFIPKFQVVFGENESLGLIFDSVLLIGTEGILNISQERRVFFIATDTINSSKQLRSSEEMMNIFLIGVEFVLVSAQGSKCKQSKSGLLVMTY